MKIALQYLNDVNGKTQAVHLPFNDWQKLLSKINKYEQALKLKSDLKESLEQASVLKKIKGNKQTLKDFLNGI